jgi:RNA polymerase sigma-70 factor (ECF subfamily)
MATGLDADSRPGGGSGRAEPAEARDGENQGRDAEDITELVRGALAHDRQAFGELCSRFEKMVFFTAYRLVGNEADAMDVVQNTLMRGYRNLRSYDQSRSFRIWLLAIAVNEARSLLRTRRRTRHISLGSVPDAGESVAATARESTDQVAAAELKDAMESLSSDERTAFVLRYVERRSAVEVAELMGISERTVRRLCREARDGLRRLLGETGE